MTRRRDGFVVCLSNADYPASLEVRKIYSVLPDPEAEDKGLVRVIDESGESYLYPAKHFAAIDLPPDVAEARRDGEPMTIAQTIAKQFGDDGLKFSDASGSDIEGVCAKAAAEVIDHPTYGDETQRYAFGDESSIVIAIGGWDLGLSGGCHCWAGVGHDHNCTEGLG